MVTSFYTSKVFNVVFYGDKRVFGLPCYLGENREEGSRGRP
jgi:hypothetical protein